MSDFFHAGQSMFCEKWIEKGGGCTGVTMLCDQMPIGPAAHLLINSMSKVYDVSQITSHHCFPR